MATPSPRAIVLAIFAASLAFSELAFGNSAAEVFRQTSPRVFVVEARDASDKVIVQGSGVRISNQSVITNCHVAIARGRIVLKRGDKQFVATVSERDDERDLCLLSATIPDAADALRLRASTTIAVGEEVFAVGAPLGLELTISNGIVSSLRAADGGKLVQTTAAISPGSSGGGLFDAQGRLVGITTFQSKQGQNLNFAVPSEWIGQISARNRLSAQAAIGRAEFSARAEALREAKEWPLLEKEARQRIATSPLDTQGWLRLVQATAALNNLVDATSAFNKLLSIPVQSVDDVSLHGLAAFSLGGALEKAGRRREAIDVYKVMVLAVPWKPFFGQLHSLISEEGAFGEGEAIFAEATRLYPNESDAWAYLGAAQLSQGKLPMAGSAFRKAVALNINDDWAWAGLLYVLLQTGDKQQFNSAMATMKANASANTVGEAERTLRRMLGRS